MRFTQSPPEEPKIDLVPFIDVLLVILIFLMLTTTYSKYTDLQLTLPVASDNVNSEDAVQSIEVTVDTSGHYTVERQPLAQQSAEALADALRAAGAQPKTRLIISADAATAHQSVITVMDAARRLGLTQITFLAQTSDN